MKKILLILTVISFASSVYAQRCAVMEFKARVGISQSDVDGISAIFLTYFRPEGYTLVERAQIDKVIDEQGFQRSTMTQSQMVRIGKILNVSIIVVGDVNITMGQYNVDTRAINVETGTVSATEGATFGGTSYRASMKTIAQNLAAKIAISPGPTVSAVNTDTSNPRKRTEVEVLYGYLKVFPNELGVFESEPSTIIKHLNSQVQYGYNNWRIPTNEELALLRANGYLGNGSYMTKENSKGIVLLVTDGKDYLTIQKEEDERLLAKQQQLEKEKAEAERKKAEKEKAEAERKRLEKEKAEAERRQLEKRLDNEGLVDLGLSVYWSKCNLGAKNPEEYGIYRSWGEPGRYVVLVYDWYEYHWYNETSKTLTKYNTSSSYGIVDYKTVLDAEDDIVKYDIGGKWRMPTNTEWKELETKCTCTWTTQNGVAGCKITSNINGNSIFLPAAGRKIGKELDKPGIIGAYWSSSLDTDNPKNAWNVFFSSGKFGRYTFWRSSGFSIRPVADK